MTTKQATSYGYLNDKTALLKRLSRAEGQIRGISKMVEDERYCIDIFTQLSAVQSALQTVGRQLLNSHVDSCLKDALRSGDSQAATAKTEELLDAIERFTRLK